MSQRDRIELHFWKCEDENLPANSGYRIQVSGIEARCHACQEPAWNRGRSRESPPGGECLG